jgi:hypothetical protein
MKTSSCVERSEVELVLLFRAVAHDEELKHLRDHALLGLLGLQALRTVEIMRANVLDSLTKVKRPRVSTTRCVTPASRWPTAIRTTSSGGLALW